MQMSRDTFSVSGNFRSGAGTRQGRASPAVQNTSMSEAAAQMQDMVHWVALCIG